MLFEMQKSKIFYGGDCHQRCNAMIVSSLCLERRECIDYPEVLESRLSDNCFLGRVPE